ncbi:unnamed protein product [Anisakis simplex]|uniref:Secreted protein n=1 Tax=Anisakis simplex TaxID=6269 RepID=A0A0M3KGD9_ANISI|nr:unnamed protein product [Anisakis simplex]
MDRKSCRLWLLLNFFGVDYVTSKKPPFLLGRLGRGFVSKSCKVSVQRVWFYMLVRLSIKQQLVEAIRERNHVLLPLVALAVGVARYRSHLDPEALILLDALTVGVASYRTHLIPDVLLPLLALSMGMAKHS